MNSRQEMWAILLQTYCRICMPKLSKYKSYCRNKWVQFLPHSVDTDASMKRTERMQASDEMILINLARMGQSR